jgi:hypothetical protein
MLNRMLALGRPGYIRINLPRAYTETCVEIKTGFPGGLLRNSDVPEKRLVHAVQLPL